ncbi:hypothetical protein [Rheinheimera sp. F8]|uniref:hypothetical protein n=1 Tax=Rheinheimera sp. F8 TaxID=1763998 RepID=UPI000744CB4A|nr:hypothetical protein [Rheinheimera sp. F8]ALZ76201.1 hypothetical protein ATY27_10805 [Rheinheimera sp. F8]ALZ77618.1 hypothetical protein ATY27_18850 [Rheinheimera sp. F8]
MNPEVTNNITSAMSELQLQFLQHLKIQPLQTDLAAPDYQAPQYAAVITAPAAQDFAVSQKTALQSIPAAMPPEPVLPQWTTAETSLPLVQDMLMFLQQAGVQAQWFYQAAVTDIHLTAEGLFSAPPQHFLAAASKKQLWQSLVQQLPAEISTDTDPT